MKNTLYIVLLGSALLAACTEEQPSTTARNIAGAYAREFSYEVTHPETGQVIGRRTIRDTLFIRANGNGFAVSQTKWRLNDFDQQGWQNQQHGEDRPLPVYQAAFQSTGNTIQAVPPGNIPALRVDTASEVLYRGENSTRAYHKVK